VTQETAAVGETGLGAEEDKFSGPVKLDQAGEEQAAEERAQHPHRQQEGRTGRDPAPAVEREAAAGHDHVDMRMVRQRRAPGVEHRGDADEDITRRRWQRRDQDHEVTTPPPTTSSPS